MKNQYEKPEIIVTSFIGEDTMTLTVSNVTYSNVSKTSTNTFDLTGLHS